MTGSDGHTGNSTRVSIGLAVSRYEDAAQTLRQYVKNHGDRPDAAKARRWLDRLKADGKIKG